MSNPIQPWPTMSLGILAAEMCLGKMLDKLKNRGTLQPYLGNVNVRWFSFDLSDLKEMRFEDVEGTRFELQAGDLVICEGGEPGRAAVWRGQTEKAKIQKALHRVRFRPDEYDPTFAMYYLYFGTITNRFAQYYTGTTIKHLTGVALSQVQFPIPSVNEQGRIVAKIDELFSDLDAGVAALKRAKANLKRYRAAVLKAAVEGKLTEEWQAEHPAKEPASKLLERILIERRQKWEANQLAKFAAAEKEPPKNWREKYVEPTPPDTTDLPELPESWCWATLGQLLHGIEGGKSFKCLTRPAADEEWGVIKVSAMTWGTFLEDEQKAIPPTSAFDPSDEIRSNDLLLSRCNTSELVGATVLVGNCRTKLLLSDKSLRLKVPDLLDRRWLHKVLSSSVARRQLSAMATGTSDSMRNVSQEKIESVLLPLPPNDEQEVIVTEVEERISIITASEHQVHSNLLRAARLRQSILKQAFEGNLVPQDPKDEPASLLLERMNAERHARSAGRLFPNHRKKQPAADIKEETE